MLEYYYRGVASWDWFYPYHYAPMASDLVDLGSVNVEFSLGQPFLPYQQLLAVLPAASAKLLPAPYQVCVGWRWGKGMSLRPCSTLAAARCALSPAPPPAQSTTHRSP